MLLEEAKDKLEPLINRKLGDLVDEEQMEGIIRAKGRTGQLLEILIGNKNSPRTLDFTDGELKTNKCDRYGKPLETMFITQINSIIDDLISKKDFYGTHLYEKISNLLYVPICKEGDPWNWFFLPYIHVNLNDEKNYGLKVQLRRDYYSICEQLKVHIETSDDGYIHTSNGELIQIRSKDSKPYGPIFSNIYDRYVSNKNHAFYFKKEFMRYIAQNG